MTAPRPIEDILRDPASTAEIQRAVDALDRAGEKSTLKLFVLRNFTVETCLSALRFAGYRRDVRLEVTLSGFDTFAQDAITAGEAMLGADGVVVWLWLESMAGAFDASGELDVEAAKAQILGVVDLVASKTRAPIYLHTVVAPLGQGHGWSNHDALDALNLALRQRARSDKRVHVVDVARIEAELGRAASIDARFALTSAAPFSQTFARVWGESLAEISLRARGRVKKVLVVDADDTLWGGVVGEDGVAGIRLDAHRFPGNAYHAFQRQLLALRARGVLLALASKNEPESVLEVLDRHPSSALKREHFAAMRIGWGRKSEAIREMADELKLGLEAFVFIDDSEVELAEVASALPVVQVARMPREAAKIPSVLSSLEAFAGLADTSEDRLRAAHYGAERTRDELRATHADLDAFIASLELEATLGPPSHDEIDRVAQLTQRTNQFNVTTLRYEAADIERMLASDRFLVTALRARDRFGDYGLTGVAIAELSDDGSARIDSLLMSCRTLGRKLEDALLADLCARIREVSPSAPILAEVRFTKKNGVVAGFFSDRGFAPVDRTEARSTFVLAHGAPVAPRVIRTRRLP